MNFWTTILKTRFILDLLLYIKVAWRPCSVLPTSQREGALAQFVNLTVLLSSDNGLRAPTDFQLLRRKYIQSLNQASTRNTLIFPINVGAQSRRHPTLQNITTSGDVREDYWEFIKVQAIVIYVQVIHNYNSTFEDANRLVAAPLDGG